MVDIDPLYTHGTYLPPEPEKKKRWVLAIIVVAVLLLGAGIFVALQHKHTTNNKPHSATTTNNAKTGPRQTGTNSTNTSSTPQGTPTTPDEDAGFTNVMMNDDNPTHIQYTVTSGSSPITDWYIVHVTATNSYGTFNQIAVIHQDIDGNQDVIAGPDTSFPRSYLESQDVPQEVINQLPVYDDTAQ